MRKTETIGSAAALELRATLENGEIFLSVHRGEFSASLMCAANELELTHDRTGETRLLHPHDAAMVGRWMDEHDAWEDHAREEFGVGAS